MKTIDLNLQPFRFSLEKKYFQKFCWKKKAVLYMSVYDYFCVYSDSVNCFG